MIFRVTLDIAGFSADRLSSTQHSGAAAIASYSSSIVVTNPQKLDSCAASAMKLRVTRQ